MGFTVDSQISVLLVLVLSTSAYVLSLPFSGRVWYRFAAARPRLRQDRAVRSVRQMMNN